MMVWQSRYQCPKCSGRLKRVRPEPGLSSFFTAITADIGFQVIWVILAGAIAAVSYRLFGEVAALFILFAMAFAIDHAIARYRCCICGLEMNRNERVSRPDN